MIQTCSNADSLDRSRSDAFTLSLFTSLSKQGDMFVYIAMVSAPLDRFIDIVSYKRQINKHCNVLSSVLRLFNDFLVSFQSVLCSLLIFSGISSFMGPGQAGLKLN